MSSRKRRFWANFKRSPPFHISAGENNSYYNRIPQSRSADKQSGLKSGKVQICKCVLDLLFVSMLFESAFSRFETGNEIGNLLDRPEQQNDGGGKQTVIE